jgi:ubiquinone/menaquinone biosynthesis C-methylase UbiE
MKKFNFDFAADEYDKFYDDPAGMLIDDLEKKMIGKLIKKLNGRLLVELGSGTGHWTSFFADKGFSVVGLDISSKMIEYAVRKNIPGSVFINHNIQHLPFADNSVENIAAIASIEFVENQDMVFSEIKRVLKPGGSFIIGCLNINSIIGKNKSQNEIFKDAEFFSADSLNDRLSKIGSPEIYGCVLMNEKNEITDDQADEEQLVHNGVFLAGMVTKHI